MGFSERELLARLIKCEAEGEGENGMKAVASVVMNRVRVPFGEYQRVNQGDIRRVIFQEDQFTCLKTSIGGVPNPQNIYNMAPDQVHYDIADWALAGNRLYDVGYSLWYFNPFNPLCPYFFPPNRVGSFQVHIALHCFYNPTSKYYDT
ncbi:MAG: cell wall hydrolase [Anaeromicrobium sp.]|jgi:N-acetylmuramoyl-L-alanine amidase|uniref:cell wall hydrolase n=1 Tax=Anaeromicrobium sp. TaxID=1929132 RepID=UPI0025F809D9|nr:cell wall hydrolase [Anaeromicrobium sp.]MCT4595984.1 cell wall hydrolase [Anaeromicrobium sp.]